MALEADGSFTDLYQRLAGVMMASAVIFETGSRQKQQGKLPKQKFPC